MEPQTPDPVAMLAKADAALVIGDPALRAGVAGLPFAVMDLGEEWVAMTGLPMVFAVWACRKDAKADWLAEAFADSCRYGRERLEEIARQEAAARGLDEVRAAEQVQGFLTGDHSSSRAYSRNRRIPWYSFSPNSLTMWCRR